MSSLSTMLHAHRALLCARGALRIALRVAAGGALVSTGIGVACAPETTIDGYVAGFDPQAVRYEIEQLGALDDAAIAAVRRRPDVDGAQLLPAGSCPTPCRAVLLSAYATNTTKEPMPPPVVRVDPPAGRPRRVPIAFTGDEITPGRIGRVRWLVQLWPEEQTLATTLSSSVRLVTSSGSAPAPALGATTRMTTSPTTGAAPSTPSPSLASPASSASSALTPAATEKKP